jgi:hypothetical protein
MESGQRRIDLTELIELGKAIGFDAADMAQVVPALIARMMTGAG